MEITELLPANLDAIEAIQGLALAYATVVNACPDPRNEPVKDLLVDAMNRLAYPQILFKED